MAPPPRYTLNGQPVTVSELAAMAGCDRRAMQQRLTGAGLTPEEAVAAGAKMARRYFGRKMPARTPDSSRRGGPAPTISYRGRMVYVAELAALAGCKPDTLRHRITKLGMTPEDAVAAGPQMARRGYSKADFAGASTGTAPAAKLKTAKAPSVALDPREPAVTPAHVKPFVAPKPPDHRFVPTVVPSTFGRIGSYERTGSALERALEGKT